MENKINVAEILKDCPLGMELNCTMYDDIFFYEITDDPVFPIHIKRIDGSTIALTKYGEYADCPSAKCVIFPKGKTTWEGFVPPYQFKDGDIIAMENSLGIHIFIYNNTTAKYGGCGYYVILTNRGNFKINGFCSGSTYRLVTEEEKEKLFKAIKDNGYYWNPETKTLDKLITSKKFDIITLKPFDKVLVRNTKTCVWTCDLYSHYSSSNPYNFVCTSNAHQQCIPYNDDTKYLLGTTNDCDEFYKNWK